MAVNKVVDAFHYDKNKPRTLRNKVAEEAFRLTEVGVQEFQNRFPGVTSLHAIYMKLKVLNAASDSWLATKVSEGKIARTAKSAADLGAGTTELQNIDATGFQKGVKTARMSARTLAKKK